jgi:hypothetical protein
MRSPGRIIEIERRDRRASCRDGRTRVQLDHLATEPRTGRQLELEPAPARSSLPFDERVKAFDARFLFRRARRRAAAHPQRLAPQQLARDASLFSSDSMRARALLEVIGVAAVVRHELARDRSRRCASRRDRGSSGRA